MSFWVFGYLFLQAAELPAGDLFGSRPGCMVILELESGKQRSFNTARCDQRFLPFSTYKWPHTLIGLELGEITDLETVVDWDRKRFPPEDWWGEAQYRSWGRDQTVVTAFRNSVVWYYRDLAPRIGEERMLDYLARWHYGNGILGEPLDGFWLSGDLSISANEQVEFLKRWHRNELGLSKRTQSLAREIFMIENGPEYRLYAKTGAGRIDDNRWLGWYVGVVERENATICFALNLEGDSFRELWAIRAEIAHAVLARLGYLPGS